MCIWPCIFMTLKFIVKQSLFGVRIKWSIVTRLYVQFKEAWSEEAIRGSILGEHSVITVVFWEVRALYLASFPALQGISCVTLSRETHHSEPAWHQLKNKYLPCRFFIIDLPRLQQSAMSFYVKCAYFTLSNG